MIYEAIVHDLSMANKPFSSTLKSCCDGYIFRSGAQKKAELLRWFTKSVKTRERNFLFESPHYSDWYD